MPVFSLEYDVSMHDDQENSTWKTRERRGREERKKSLPK